MHGAAIAGYKKITARNHSSKIPGRGLKDQRDCRFQSVPEKADQTLFFGPDERDDIYPVPVKGCNELTKILNRPSLRPCFPTSDENSHRRCSIPRDHFSYFLSSFLLLR